MKKNIAVVAANGRVARKVITEANQRGWDVTAFVRTEAPSDAQHVIVKDIFDLRRKISKASMLSSMRSVLGRRRRCRSTARRSHISATSSKAPRPAS